MFQEITHAPVFGLPVIAYMGMAVFASFLFTASISVMNRRGIHTIPFKWHPRLAVFSICFAALHGTLGILAYF